MKYISFLILSLAVLLKAQAGTTSLPATIHMGDAELALEIKFAYPAIPLNEHRASLEAFGDKELTKSLAITVFPWHYELDEIKKYKSDVYLRENSLSEEKLQTIKNQVGNLDASQKSDSVAILYSIRTRFKSMDYAFIVYGRFTDSVSLTPDGVAQTTLWGSLFVHENDVWKETPYSSFPVVTKLLFPDIKNLVKMKYSYNIFDEISGGFSSEAIDQAVSVKDVVNGILIKP